MPLLARTLALKDLTGRRRTVARRRRRSSFLAAVMLAGFLEALTAASVAFFWVFLAASSFITLGLGFFFLMVALGLGLPATSALRARRAVFFFCATARLARRRGWCMPRVQLHRRRTLP